jgi:hypothetical protein
MGNFLKNRRLESASTSVVVPFGVTATRPDAPTFGQFRFNLDLGLMEFFDGIQFRTLAPTGSLVYTVDSFVGDEVTDTFTMSVIESDATQLIVFVGSIHQDPHTAYSVNGGFDIVFSSPPPMGEPISVIHSTT